jgi:hypothetical protein
MLSTNSSDSTDATNKNIPLQLKLDTVPVIGLIFYPLFLHISSILQYKESSKCPSYVSNTFITKQNIISIDITKSDSINNTLTIRDTINTHSYKLDDIFYIHFCSDNNNTIDVPSKDIPSNVTIHPLNSNKNITTVYDINQYLAQHFNSSSFSFDEALSIIKSTQYEILIQCIVKFLK